MKLMILFLCISVFPISASALEIEAPPVPTDHYDWMPENTESLSEGIQEILIKSINAIRPDIREASRISMGMISAVLLVSMVQTISPQAKRSSEMMGSVTIAAILLTDTNAMIHLAIDTIQGISDYGKLLLPVMTTALAAQGGITASGAIYAGTAFFISVLQSALDAFLVPGIYLYLALSTGCAATGEDLMRRTGDLLKQFLVWCLKTILIVFTTYLSLTHVISGTTDAAALKAAKVSMSSFIPVVGSILSDTSEAVLVSAGMMKNAAGIYGILAVLALFLHPFLEIGLHYLILKVTGAVCSIFGTSRICAVIDSFSSSMGLLLGMTGAECIMVLISTVCFMKGVG